MAERRQSFRAPQQDGRAWSAPAGCRDHVSGPDTADRLGLDPGQPGGTRAVRTPAVGAGGVRPMPGASEIHAIRNALSAQAGASPAPRRDEPSLAPTPGRSATSVTPNWRIWAWPRA